MAVDDTSAVGASIKKIDTPCGSTAAGRCVRHPCRKLRQPLRQSARPENQDARRRRNELPSRDPGIVLPDADVGEGVGANHEEQLGRLISLAMETIEASLAVYDGRSAARARDPTLASPLPPATAIAIMAKRWNAEALGRGRCGGHVRRNHQQRGRAATHAATAAPRSR